MMLRLSAAAALAMLLTACNPSETASKANAPVVASEPAATPTPASPPASTLPPDQITAAADIKACFLTPEQVSAGLGGTYKTAEVYAVTPETPSCIYNGEPSQFRINVTWIDPPQVEAWVAALTKPLAGEITAIAGDPNNAYFQYQGGDLSTCAVFWVKGNLQYQYRLMSCKDAEAAKAKLAALPRP